MTFIWPPLMHAVEERQKKIAHGLAAADRGEQELQKAQQGADEILREARERAQKIIDQAQHRANDIQEQARVTATQEGQRLVASAQQQIDLEATRARESLRREVGGMVVAAASKLLEREIDPNAHQDLISKLAAQI
jgi:F-type H+-transporting ATPase subunit b